jgi:glycerol uptake facilitator-like aquaporin
MDLMNELDIFYKNSIILDIVNIFYKYITYCLCVIYLIWFFINIILNNNLKEIVNENYSNCMLIFYSFYKIFSMIKLKSNYITDIIVTFILLFCIFTDITNEYNLYYIHYWIFYSLLISIGIFIYGTMYIIFSSDFIQYNYDDIEFIAEICSETV